MSSIEYQYYLNIIFSLPGQRKLQDGHSSSTCIICSIECASGPAHDIVWPGKYYCMISLKARSIYRQQSSSNQDINGQILFHTQFGRVNYSNTKRKMF